MKWVTDLQQVKEDIKKYIIESTLTDSNQVKYDTLIFDNGLLGSMGFLFLIEFLKENYDVEIKDEELNPENTCCMSYLISSLKFGY